MTALQIRDLPPEVHRTLKARAAKAGQSLSEYAGQVLRASAQTPTISELTARIRTRGTAGTVSADEVAELIRRERTNR
jgi:plasmid stability protein